MLAGGRSRDCLPCPAPCLLTSFTTEPDSYLVAIYFWGGWEKIGVRLRHAGTHGKERRKNSLVIFSSSLPMSLRALHPNPNLLSSQKRINSDWVPICHWTTHLHTQKTVSLNGASRRLFPLVLVLVFSFPLAHRMQALMLTTGTRCLQERNCPCI